MKPVLTVLAKTEDSSLTHWGNESGLDGTMQSYIYALMRKYNVIRPFVTVESDSGKMYRYLTQTYAKDIVSATYSRLSQSIVSEGELPGYTSFIIRCKDLDAFYFQFMGGGCGGSLVVFFTDPKVFNPLKEKKQEFFQYPLGNYTLEESMFGYYLMPLSMSQTEKPILDGKMMDQLLVDTDVFFSSADFYHGKNPIGAQIPHKRGILLIGPPGNGKTTYLKSYLTHTKDKYGVIIDCAKYLSNQTFQWLSETLGDRPKVLIFEDVDGVAQNYGSRSAFLNFLDGANELNNTLVIATTNFPQRLDDAILDRPSRFDTILYLGKPNAEMRKVFLVKWFPYLHGDDSRLNALAVGTDGFSGAYFKELFLMSGLRKCSVEEALSALKERQRLIKMAKSGDIDNYRPDDSMEQADIFEVIEMEKPMFANLVASLRTHA